MKIPFKLKSFRYIKRFRSESDITEISKDPSIIISLAHQIKTPLNAIIGFSDLLKEPDLSAQSRSVYVNHINTSGKYLLELINGISDITKIETGQMFAFKTECNLNQVLKDLYEKYLTIISEKNKTDLEFRVSPGIDDDRFTVLTDEPKLRKILQNLLDNALVFTDGGLIEFGYIQRDDIFIEFFVRDAGSGFSMHRLETILERLHNVLDNRMRPFDSAALRLNISKHLVRILGGKLTANSEMGKGSEFCFSLPLNTAEAYSTEDILIKDQAKSNQWGNYNILIAEDVESNFIYLKEILKPTCVNLAWAKNGREAVKKMNESQGFDLIIMDIMMPEMDGYEAARKIWKKHPKVPIVAQTAFSLEGDEYQESLNYFNRYLIKPIWSHDLIQTLKEYLNG